MKSIIRPIGRPLGRPLGRPVSNVRQKILQALQDGIVGTVEGFALHAGVSMDDAKGVLYQLRYERVVQVVGQAQRAERCMGRPRAIYGPRATHSPVDAIAFARLAWR